MNLDKLTILNSEEKTTEMREVTVTLTFEMEDGKCVDESLQPLYDYVAPKKEEVEEPETTSTTDGLNYFEE